MDEFFEILGVIGIGISVYIGISYLCLVTFYRFGRPLQVAVRPMLWGHCPVLSAMFVCCGQTVGWIKMPLGTEVALGPGDIVTWRPSYPTERGTAAHRTLQPMSILAKWSPISATAELLLIDKLDQIFTRIMLWYL